MTTTVIDDTDFAIKPMNCPGGILVYQSEPRSYRDLPLRMGELGIVHRHEKSGQLHGLMRVRCFTQDDAHIFMLPEQIKDEVIGVVKFIDDVYKMFGFTYHIELSTRPDDSMGTDEEWEAEFIEACQQTERINYYLDLLVFGELQDRIEFLLDSGKDVKRIEERMEEYRRNNKEQTGRSIG